MALTELYKPNVLHRKLFDRVYGNWTEWFAWYPVKINNEWRWFSKVYRRWSSLFGVPDRAGGAYYQYGTIFDVLRYSEYDAPFRKS